MLVFRGGFSYLEPDEHMFTGIIEETGEVLEAIPGEASIRLVIRARVAAEGLKVGDSLAVNGCCLTLVRATGSGAARKLEFDLLRETWDRTNLQFGTQRLGGLLQGLVQQNRVTTGKRMGQRHFRMNPLEPRLLQAKFTKGR